MQLFLFVHFFLFVMALLSNVALVFQSWYEYPLSVISLLKILTLQICLRPALRQIFTLHISYSI